MRGPCRKAPPVASCRPSRSMSLLPKTPRRGIAGSPYPARTAGEQTSPRWNTIPTPSARKRRSAPSAAPRWSWESERIPTFTAKSQGADGREERLTDLLLAIGGLDLPPVPVDDVEDVGHLVRFRGDLGERDVDPQRRQRARDVVEEPDPVVGEDVDHGAARGDRVVEDDAGGPVPGDTVPDVLPRPRLGHERLHGGLPPKDARKVRDDALLLRVPPQGLAEIVDVERIHRHAVHGGGDRGVEDVHAVGRQRPVSYTHLRAPVSYTHLRA